MQSLIHTWGVLRKLPGGWQALKRQGKLNKLTHLEKAAREPNYTLRYIIESTAAFSISLLTSGCIVFVLLMMVNKEQFAIHANSAQALGQIWVVGQETIFAVVYVLFVLLVLAINAYVSSRLLRSPERRALELRKTLGELSEEELTQLSKREKS